MELARTAHVFLRIHSLGTLHAYRVEYHRLLFSRCQTHGNRPRAGVLDYNDGVVRFWRSGILYQRGKSSSVQDGVDWTVLSLLFHGICSFPLCGGGAVLLDNLGDIDSRVIGNRRGFRRIEFLVVSRGVYAGKIDKGRTEKRGGAFVS